MFNSMRLQVARQRRAMTLTGLAGASGVSLRSLTNYESGKSEPSLDSLARIAEVLVFPVDYFFRTPLDPLGVRSVSFRKLSKTSAVRRDAVLASALTGLEYFGLVEERFRLPAPSIPTLDKFNPSQAAEILRREWNLGDRPVGNLLHLLESKGVRVMSVAREHAEIDAFCFYRDGVPYAFVNTTKSHERQRFDLAHELGHLVLHDEREMTPVDSKSREAEANAFAAEFLMPTVGVIGQGMYGASVDRILLGKAYWRVSAMSFTHRLKELGLLNEWQYRSTAVALSEAGFRKSEPGGVGPETSQLLKKVIFGHAGISVSQAAEILCVPRSDLTSLLHGLVPVPA